MRTIKFHGKDYQMSYNLAAAIAYERMTGRNPLDLQQFNEGKIEPIVRLGYCMIVGIDDTIDLPDYGNFVQGIGLGDEFVAFINAITEEMKEYYDLQVGDKPQKEPTKKADGEPKNA